MLVKHKSAISGNHLQYHHWAWVSNPGWEAPFSWITARNEHKLQQPSALYQWLSHPQRQCGLKKALKFSLWVPGCSALCPTSKSQYCNYSMPTCLSFISQQAVTHQQPMKEGNILPFITGYWLVPQSIDFTAPPGHWESVLFLSGGISSRNDCAYPIAKGCR